MVLNAQSSTALAQTTPPKLPSAKTGVPARTDRIVRLNVTLIVNGSPSGEVAVETNTAGVATVDATQLLERVKPLIDATLLTELTRRAAGRASLLVSDLSYPGFPIFFDVASLQLRVDIPADSRAVSTLSLSGDRFLAGAEPGDPSAFAFGVSLTVSDRIGSRGVLDDLQRDPLIVAAQGFVNLGGKQGAYLTFQGGLREGETPFRRRTTLFHDDTERAIRYGVGDLDPVTAGSFALPISVVGVGVERLYETIQPYRNLRPSGRGALTLQRPSRVDVLVNGAPYRTLDLQPGRYDLRNFPFLDGLNDVQLVVRDDTGRAETIGLSFFSNVELLAKGITIFSATAGFRQDDFDQFGSTRYRHAPTVSGLIQAGLTDGVTLGASVQSDQRNTFATAQAIFGTKLGLFSFEGALDRSSTDRLQAAGLASYRLVIPGADGRTQRLDVDFQYRTRRFTPLEPADTFVNRYRYDLTARYQLPLPARFYGNFGGGYSRAYGIGQDLVTASAGLSKTFGRLVTNVNYTYRDDDRGRDHRALASVSLALGKRSYARASFDSASDRASLNYSRQAFEGLNQTSVDVTVGRDRLGPFGNVEIEHFANRARLLFVHDYVRTNGLTSERTDVAVTTGIGYADGQAAIGRDPGRGFVIVAADPSIRKSPITVSNQYSLGPTARTGLFGPALVPLQRPYQPDALEVAVRNLPPGYDIGPGRINILPGAASGYLWKIGSAASNTIVGRLLGVDGMPAAYLSGVLRSLDDQSQPPIPFFTNGTGRLVAQKMPPGRFAVVPAGRDRPIAEIVVPKGSIGLVDIGTLTAKE